MGKYIKMDENFVHSDWDGFDINNAIIPKMYRRSGFKSFGFNNALDYLNCRCSICGKYFHKKRYYVDKFVKLPLCCSEECSKELRKTAYLSNKNPNSRYDTDSSFFDNIDSEEKAYLLGWIASDGSIRKQGFYIGIHEKDIDTLTTLRNIINCKIPIKKTKRNMVGFTVNSIEIAQKLGEILNIDISEKKAKQLSSPNIDQKLINSFMRGIFEGDGNIFIKQERYISVSISSRSEDFIKWIKSFYGFGGISKTQQDHTGEYQYVFSITGGNALDFLYLIYNNSNPELRLKRKYEQFLQGAQIGYLKNINSKNISTPLGVVRCKKTEKEAVLPSKTRASDSGYDLTCIKEWKRTGEVIYYDTGIAVIPPDRVYFQVFGRSSISKTGYMLANNVAIIDQSYRGSIKIPLIKIDKNAPDLKPPFTICQMIPFEFFHFPVEETFEIDITDRGDGGFGSTNDSKKFQKYLITEDDKFNNVKPEGTTRLGGFGSTEGMGKTVE